MASSEAMRSDGLKIKMGSGFPGVEIDLQKRNLVPPEFRSTRRARGDISGMRAQLGRGLRGQNYAFDTWMERRHEGNTFARYADDIVIHFRTQEEAEYLLEEIKLRLAECKLTVHPEKMNIVYCKDRNRWGVYERTEFDFLGYTFRPRTARGKNGKLFVAFTPAISKTSEQAIKDTIRTWRIQRAATAILESLSELYNAKLAGLFAYYGKFRPSALYGVFCMLQKILVKWAKCTYKRLKRSWLKAAELMKNAVDRKKHLFIHWEHGWYANGRV